MTYTEALEKLIELRQYHSEAKEGLRGVFMRRKEKPHEFYCYYPTHGKNDGELIRYTYNPSMTNLDTPNGTSVSDRLKDDWELVEFKVLKIKEPSNG